MDQQQKLITQITKEEDTMAYPAQYRSEIEKLLKASIADNTKKAYHSRIKIFFKWCEDNDIGNAFPVKPEIIAAYLAYLSSRDTPYSTVALSMTAIKVLHKLQGQPDPTSSNVVKQLLRGYRRQHGTATHKKAAATIDIIKKMIDSLREESQRDERDLILSSRDQAIIMLGFCGAFRRSELSDLNLEDLTWTKRKDDQDVLIVTVRKSKTDQEGTGQVKVIYPSEDKRYCPLRLLRKWINLSGITEGPLFRPVRRGGHIQNRRLTTQYIAKIIKWAAEKAQIELDLSGHSLRSGFVTTAIRQGKTERSIMHQTGHKSVVTLREYIQRESIIDDNAAEGIVK